MLQKIGFYKLWKTNHFRTLSKKKRKIGQNCGFTREFCNDLSTKKPMLKLLRLGNPFLWGGGDRGPIAPLSILYLAEGGSLWRGPCYEGSFHQIPLISYHHSCKWTFKIWIGEGVILTSWKTSTKRETSALTLNPIYAQIKQTAKVDQDGEGSMILIRLLLSRFHEQVRPLRIPAGRVSAATWELAARESWFSDGYLSTGTSHPAVRFTLEISQPFRFITLFSAVKGHTTGRYVVCWTEFTTRCRSRDYRVCFE